VSLDKKGMDPADTRIEGKIGTLKKEMPTSPREEENTDIKTKEEKEIVSLGKKSKMGTRLEALKTGSKAPSPAGKYRSSGLSKGGRRIHGTSREEKGADSSTGKKGKVP